MTIEDSEIPSNAERWGLLADLDEELLLGNVMLSEWAAFLAREADVAFAGGAYLSAILAAVAAIETHLRAEFGGSPLTLAALVKASDLTPPLRDELHRLRRYRNHWVHVDDADDDEEVLRDPERFEREVAHMARVAVRLMRRTLYEGQGT